MGLKNFFIFSFVLLIGLKLIISEFVGNVNYEELGKCYIGLLMIVIIFSCE